MFDRVNQNVISWCQGTQIEIVINNVDRIWTSWCQKEQIKFVVIEVHSRTYLNYLDHDIQYITVSPTTMYLKKAIMPLPLLGLLQLVTKIFLITGFCLLLRLKISRPNLDHKLRKRVHCKA
jgi:hypothetical protein